MSKFFCDEFFIYDTWLNALGFINHVLLITIQLLVLWCISDSSYAFLDMLQQEISHLALFGMFMGVFITVIPFLFVVKDMVLWIPIKLISSLDEIEADKELEFETKHKSILSSVGIGIFAFVLFIVSGADIKLALEACAKTTLLVSFGALGMHLTMIVLQIIMLLLRFLVQYDKK